jgi:O-antigen/teichoic acid export membrane protein
VISRLLHSLRDRAVQRVIRNGLPVTLGKAFTSVAGLVTLALLAHRLGPELLGVIAVIRTVVGVVDQYSNFNTWLAIVKYGTEAVAAARPHDVERVIKLSVMIDVATGLVGGVVVIVLAFAIPSTFDWDAHQARLCALYAITIMTRVSGTSDGIFRLCDAWRAQAIATSIAAALMTALVAVAVAADAAFDACVIALIVGEVIGNAIITIVSFWVARRAGYGGWPRSSTRGLRATYPGLLRFLLATNGQLTVKKTQTELDVFFVGAMLGKAASGLFRVVKQLGTIPGRVFMPFEQVLFTELARGAATADYAGFGRVLRRFTGLVTIGALVVWAIAVVAAEPLISVVAGSDFVAAVPAFRWYLLAMVLVVANAPVQRAVIALGRAGALFVFDLATLAFLVVAVALGAELDGLVGVCLAVVLHKVVQIAWSIWYVTRELGRATARASGAA